MNKKHNENGKFRVIGQNEQLNGTQLIVSVIVENRTELTRNAILCWLEFVFVRKCEYRSQFE